MLVVGDQAPHEDAVVSSDFWDSEGMLGSCPHWVHPSCGSCQVANLKTLGWEEQLEGLRDLTLVKM